MRMEIVTISKPKKDLFIMDGQDNEVMTLNELKHIVHKYPEECLLIKNFIVYIGRAKGINLCPEDICDYLNIQPEQHVSVRHCNFELSYKKPIKIKPTNWDNGLDLLKTLW